MKSVIIYFPHILALTDFLLDHRINNIDVQTRDLSVTGVMEDDIIVAAETKYNAITTPVKEKYRN